MKKYLIGFLTLVILTASIYVMLPDNVKIVVEKTYTEFKVWENESWVTSGKEYTKIYDGTKLMRANNRVVNYTIEGNKTTIYRYAYFKDGIIAIDTYEFDGNITDIELIPISHNIRILNAQGKIFQYEVRDILYDGETKVIASPFSFGHNMKVEWEVGNYYSKVFQQIVSDKIIVKYRVDSDDFSKDIRLFDPEWGSLNISWDNYQIFNITGNDTFSVPVGVSEIALLMVAGGGPGGYVGTGGNQRSGGGGSGELYFNESYPVTPEEVIQLYVGLGGINATNGTSSYFEGEETIGGGMGGGDTIKTGNSGGSAGGGYCDTGTGYAGGNAINVIGLGNDGKAGSASAYGGGGGGSAAEGSTSTGGLGTIIWGLMWSRGGGGGVDNQTVHHAENNTGNGGQGVQGGVAKYGGDGGSGVIIVAWNYSATIDLNSPADDASDVLIPAILNVTVGNVNANDMNITFVNDSDDSIICENNSVTNGTVVLCSWDELVEGTEYQWFVNMTDNNSNTKTSSTWNFSTITYNPTWSNNKTNITTSTMYGHSVYFNITLADDNPSVYVFSWYNGSVWSNDSAQSYTDDEEVIVVKNITLLADAIKIEWLWYFNDTFGNSNKSDEWSIVLGPRIDYSTGTESNNSYFDRDWIYVNTSVTEDNFRDIIFNLYWSNQTILNSTNFTSQIFEVNWTGLSYGKYYYNVSIYDLYDKSNSTETREIYLSDLNLSLESLFENITVELGTQVNVSVISSVDFGNISIDIDHPSYGTNYTSSTLSVYVDLIISWFRNTLFSSGNTYSTIYFNSSNSTTNESSFSVLNFSVPVHQYDYVDNFSVNISGNLNAGNSTIYEPSVIFYKANNQSDYDRVFYGELVGSNIFIEKVFDNNNGTNLYLNETNVSFSDYGDKLIYLYLDRNADLVNFQVNLTGYEYGFNLLTNNFSKYKDDALTTAEVIGTYLFPLRNILSGWINYGQFNNATIWDITTAYTDSATCAGDGDCYDKSLVNSATSSSLTQTSHLDEEMDQADDSDNRNVQAYNLLFNYTDILSPFAPGNFTIHYTMDFDGHEDYAYGSSPTNCNYDYSLKYGGGTIIQDSTVLFTALGGVNCADNDDGSCYYSHDADVWLTLNKNEDGNDYLFNWSVNGTETYYSEYDNGVYSYFYYYIDWTNSNWTIYSDLSTSSTGNITNYGAITPSTTSEIINFSSEILAYGNTDAGTNFYGCVELDLITVLSGVNVKLNTFNESNYTTTSLYDSSAVVPTLNTLVYGGGTKQSQVYSFASTDNGDNYQNLVADGSEESMYNPGNSVKFIQEFSPNATNLSIVPYVYYLSMNTSKDFPNNVGLDFGNDGTYEYTNSTELLNTSTIRVNLTGADISAAFTGTADLAKTWLIPLRVFSSTAGIVNINAINLTYNPNPVYLNITSITNYLKNLVGFGSINISVGSVNGTLNLTDLRYDYSGGNKTYKVTAHNEDYSLNVSRNITYYFSQWDYAWIPSGVEWIYFQPKKPTSVNITPYGQTVNTPLLNFTNLGYGGKNATLSAKVNSSISCVNMTLSNTVNKTDGIVLNTTFQDIANLTYEETINMSFWADYSCSYSTYYLYRPSLFYRMCVNDYDVCDEGVV